MTENNGEVDDRLENKSEDDESFKNEVSQDKSFIFFSSSDGKEKDHFQRENAKYNCFTTNSIHQSSVNF